MNPLLLVFLGIAIYWSLVAFADARGYLPDYVSVAGPLFLLRTKRGRDLVERAAAPRRLWRAWGNFGLGAAMVVMAVSVLFFVFVAVSTVQNPPEPSAVTEPRNFLVIPGVNDYLPLSAAPEIVAGLALALVVHEGGHAILCRVGDIEIDSVGLLLLAVLPIGAFVQQDEESQQDADRGAKGRMFAAGVTNNFLLAAVGFALLFGPIAGALTVVPGAAIGTALPGTPAADAGVDRGTVITGVGDVAVDSNDDLITALRTVEGETVTLATRDGRTVSVDRTLVVTGLVAGAPSAFEGGGTVVAVNGTEVSTTPELRAALADRPIATFRMDDGDTVTMAAGAYATVQPGGPLSEAGAPNGTLTVTSVGGERTITTEDLQRLLEDTSGGDEVTVVGYADGERYELDVTLGSQDGSGFLGVYLSPGVGGVTVNDLGVQSYPAGRYLALIGGSCESCEVVPDLGFVERIYFALQLPLLGVVGGQLFPYNWAGFTGGVANFYAVGGALAGLGSLVFLLANLLFWTAWINLNLGFFNCIPTFALDGGHMLRAGMESVVSRLPFEDGERVVMAATLAVQFVMLGSLFVMIFGAQLLN